MTTTAMLGHGIFAIPEAARLLGVPGASIRRWLFGARQDTQRQPVLVPDYDPIDHQYALSFLDLVQLRFVAEFRHLGIGLREIRTAAERASELLNTQHPFATKRFLTDGRHIIAQIADPDRSPSLLTLSKYQFELEALVRPLLRREIDFGDMDYAERWWPAGRDTGVVVDPTRNRGTPTLDATGVPTAVLATAADNGQAVPSIAAWYEIPQSQVEAALRFERSFAA